MAHSIQSECCLPSYWKRSVRSAVLQAISLAHYAVMHARGRSARATRTSCAVEIDRLRQYIALLREELRIKDLRMARVPPARRPHYPPVERMAILELRAAHGWSLAQTAQAFLVTPATITTCAIAQDFRTPAGAG
jgi:predicted RNA polymerase sigma factor